MIIKNVKHHYKGNFFTLPVSDKTIEYIYNKNHKRWFNYRE